MTDFIWKTAMRASLNGTEADLEARRTDRLHGQAAAKRLDDERWQLIGMPDVQTFDFEVVVSAEDMRTLAHAVLRAELPGAWADLVEAFTIMGRHPFSEHSPTHCDHDRMTVMAEPTLFTNEQLDRLRELGFHPTHESDLFVSTRFGSA